MNYPTSFNVRVASKEYNSFDMSKKVFTTQDFGVMKGLECKLCFPGDKIHLKVSQETKVLTMPAPTFGQCDMVLRAFYVPINNIWSDFNEFISNQKVASGKNVLTPVEIPFLYGGDFIKYMISDSRLTRGSNSKVDLQVPIIEALYSNNAWTFTAKTRTFEFTYLGRKFYDFIISLGLKLPPYCFDIYTIEGEDFWERRGYSFGHLPEGTDLDELFSAFSQAITDGDIPRTFSESIKNYSLQKISLLPLLAWWKFYLDWVVPARFLSNYTDIRHLFEVKNIYRDIPYQDVLFAMSRVPVSFLQDDFFTTAFSNPSGYEDSANVASNPSIPNPNSIFDSFSGDEYPEVVTSRLVGAGIKITNPDELYIQQFTLKSLGALQDMVNRGKIAGSKVKDYLEVTYGIRPSDDALHISSYLGSQRIPITFEALTNEADTYNSSTGDGSLTGSYVGRANVGNNPFEVNFNVSDKMHGFFFVTSELQVHSSYTQGLAPEFTALDKLDFYDAAIDNIGGVEAVPRSMLANIQYDTNVKNYIESGKSQSPEDIFGWVSAYAKYKCNFDNVSGDFIIPTLNEGLDSWYLSRMFTLLSLSQDYPLINEKFLQAISDDTNGSFDRIFSVANTSIDHFRSVFHIDLKMQRKMKSLRDTLDFTDGGKNVEKSVNNGVQN